ncbi:hypothetical protein L7F22_003067 [Adiantum nelumboides]|nr:hypothetical protein [Adiantum nelumboides]
MASYTDVVVDQQGNAPINMDDDMMSEYYNVANNNGQADDHAMMMMMEEPDQESSQLIADTILNDDEIASVSNEVVMEEYGNHGKVQESELYSTTSYTEPTIPADVEIQHSLGVDLPDETIGDAVYEEEQNERIHPANSIVAQQEEKNDKIDTGSAQMQGTEAEQIAEYPGETKVVGPEHDRFDSHDEYATEGPISGSANDGKEVASEKTEIVEESVNHDTGKLWLSKRRIQSRYLMHKMRLLTEVFSDSLEALFDALRIREALGDFLDEGTEICLTFHDLDMIAREDDIYIREVTLDDIQRLHSGLRYTTSMHISVSESQRFISRYNDLANQVSVLLEQKTGNQSFEEGKGEEEQTIGLSSGDASLAQVDGGVASSSKEEISDKINPKEKIEGEEEGDQDEEETFVTVTNDAEADEEQYVESYEEGGEEVQNEAEIDENVDQNVEKEDEERPKQAHLFSNQVATDDTDENSTSIQKESDLEVNAADEIYNEEVIEEVEGKEEFAAQGKDSSRDTATTLSGNGDENEDKADIGYEDAEDIDDKEADENEEEGAEELKGIEEAYEDYEEEENEEPYDDNDKEAEHAQKEEDYEENFEPQISSHGQKRQLEDEYEYSTENLGEEGIDGLHHNEDDTKRARYEDPEKGDA